MNKRLMLGVIVGTVGLATATLFQNCSKPMEAGANGVTSAASTSPSPSSVTSSPDLDHTNAQIVPQANPTSGENLVFNVEANNLPSAVTYQWSYNFTVNGVTTACNVMGSTITSKFTINCPSAGTLLVNATVVDGASSYTLPPYEGTLMAATSTPSSGSIPMEVDFTIKSGTGLNNPWNSATTQVEAFIGQNLKLINNDTIPQELHTNNNQPFPHGVPMAPGQSSNNVVLTAYSESASAYLYDHDSGTASQSNRFFITTYDPSVLYSNNCASCHGALASSTKKLATVAQIQAGIATVAAMKTPALMALTTTQIQAIAYALGTR